MRTLKEICGLLIVVGIIAVFGQFLPGLNVLFDDYFAGFLLAAIVIPVARMMYKSHMAKITKLPVDVQEKREKESKEWWKETSEATYSPSRTLDLRNIHDDV
ncbi:MAG TPA: hypothetical protein ENJ35_00660 [Gammaproteobacteria bacterium]|nr:hypothetical protein [Gammaproteobacteria bacterium]